MGYVKQSGLDDIWIVEPKDVISIYRDPTSAAD